MNGIAIQVTDNWVELDPTNPNKITMPTWSGQMIKAPEMGRIDYYNKKQKELGFKGNSGTLYIFKEVELAPGRSVNSHLFTRGVIAFSDEQSGPSVELTIKSKDLEEDEDIRDIFTQSPAHYVPVLDIVEPPRTPALLGDQVLDGVSLMENAVGQVNEVSPDAKPLQNTEKLGGKKKVKKTFLGIPSMTKTKKGKK